MIKNYKKLFLSFGAAAVLSSAAAFSSLAASGGWVSENGVWKYQEASGNYAYNTWKTSGDNSYYLDNNGVIAVNQWIDDTYYVDDDGVMEKIPGSSYQKILPRRKQAGITWTPKES